MKSVFRRTLSVSVIAVLLCSRALEAEPKSRTSPPALSFRAAETVVEDIALFTFTSGPDMIRPRCTQSITGLRLDTDTAIAGQSLGRSMLATLRGTPSLEVVVGGFGFYGWYAFDDPESGTTCAQALDHVECGSPLLTRSIYIMRRHGDDVEKWDVATTVVGPSFYHGIEIMADGDSLLLATAGTTAGLDAVAPFRVEKYSLREMTRIPVAPDREGTHRLGPSHGTFELPDPAVALLRSFDGHRVHILTASPPDFRNPLDPSRLLVLTIDVATMSETGTRVALPGFLGQVGLGLVTLPTATLSPDGRYMVTTAGLQGTINVVDLVERRAWPARIENVSEVSDVSFALGERNHGLLALNTRRFGTGTTSQVVVGELRDSEFVILGRGPEYEGDMGRAPSPVEWTADGSSIIAGVDHRQISQDPLLAVLLGVENGGREIRGRRELSLCAGNEAPSPPLVSDILTANTLAMPTATPPASATASQTPTVSVTPLSSPSPSSTAMPTASPTATPVPGPVYLPLALREECSPGFKHTDVALVIDASTSMRDEFTGAGRRKLDAAREAVAMFLNQLDLAGGDQAAIIQFNSDSSLLTGLTRREADLQRALASITVARQTRIHLGISKARTELTGPRHRPTNSAAMVVLTDGRNNPEPVAEAEREAALARADNIRVFTIGLGTEVEAEALARMATTATDYFFAPDGEDLISIYRRVAHAIPCPPEQFWGRR